MKQKLLFYFFFFLAIVPKANTQNQKPNIILILADDVGYKSLTCNGGNLYFTRNLDTLAQQGMRFTQCHVSPSCSPSRHLLLTGKYNFRNYVEWGKMDINQKTIGNMMKDAGYKTACFGKWQLNGGDQSIHKFGFDSYTVHDPLDKSEAKSRYKSPHIYTHGAFLPDSSTLNKYGPDIISDSVLNFIENNKTVPFFIYYPMILCHGPFQPTPDNAAFGNKKQGNDTSYYPSMVKYMDKLVGKLRGKIKETGIANNTVVIFIGDNGTSDRISEYADADSVITGGKWSTKENGTHVPMIVSWPETIQAGSVNNDLIDLTDFLPTLANLANTSVPTDYGILDGVSFSSRLLGQPGTPREWIFTDYVERPAIDTLKRWAQTKTYKLYDTNAAAHELLFYNIVNDVQEKNPIPDASLTAEEAVIKQQLLNVINGYVAQGLPVISLNPSLSNITQSSVVLKDTIRTNGGSTVTASGAVWSTNPNPEISSSSHTSTGVTLDKFSTTIQGLAANTTYYVRAYATNFAGTAYSNQVIFKTLGAPVATAASAIDSNAFTANWDVYTANASYRLDVSTSPTFSQIGSSTITEGFNNGVTPPAGWTISNNIIANTTAFGTASPSLEFTASNASVVTKQLSGPATELKFWIKGLNTNQTSSLIIEGFDGVSWTVITNMSGLSKNGAKKAFNATSVPPLPQNIVQFRFTYIQKSGTLAFDDVSIKYNSPAPSFISGYSDVKVTTNSKIVTGLRPATNYYYRVRATTGGITTGNSNIITATTCKAASVTGINKVNLSCHGGSNGAINLTVTGGVVPLTFVWTGPGNFTSLNEDINNLAAGTYHLTIKSNGGCAVDTNIIITEPQALTATANAGAITCNAGTTTLTVSAQGGTGSYHYTLSDGTNTTGPQDNNNFIVPAGNYTVTVADDNGCSFTTDAVHVIEPQALTAMTSADAITCSGSTTVLTVNATGGTGSYHYTLSDGTNTTGPQDDNEFIVPAGNYAVTVSDDNGCSFTTDAMNVSEPQALSATIGADPITCSGGTTILTVTATGGIGNYHYTLSNGAGSQEDNHFTVGAGNYTVTVTDDNGCSSTTDAINIDDGADPCGGIALTDNHKKQNDKIKTAVKESELLVRVFPNPSVAEFILTVQSNKNERLEIIVTDMYGKKVYQTTGSSNGKYTFGKTLASGEYFVCVNAGKLSKTVKVLKGN